jgi:alpha-beta hydrolase superfamily lysophospholipase
VIADGVYSSTEAVVAALRAEYGDETVLPNGYPPAAEPRHAVAAFSDTALLVLAGDEDKVTTPAMACEVFLQCGSHQKSLWIVPDAVHLRIPEVVGDLYFLQIRGFLDRVLEGDRSKE